MSFCFHFSLRIPTQSWWWAGVWKRCREPGLQIRGPGCVWSVWILRQQIHYTQWTQRKTPKNTTKTIFLPMYSSLKYLRRRVGWCHTCHMFDATDDTLLILRCGDGAERLVHVLLPHVCHGPLPPPHWSCFGSGRLFERFRKHQLTQL